MSPEKRHRCIKITIAVFAVLVAAGFCAGIIYAIVDYYVNDDVEVDGTATAVVEQTTVIYDHQVENPEVTGGNILDYFDHANDDGLRVTFYHGANSLSEMESALQDDEVNVLEADITLRYYGRPNQTEEPIMAHPPEADSDNTLENWFDEVIPTQKAIKMDIKVEEVIPFALEELKRHSKELQQPVWINADVVKGPNTLSVPIDSRYFIGNVTQHFPNVTLSLGWTTGYRFVGENDEYSWDSMDEMLAIASSTPQRVTFPIRASLARMSWYKFLWLLEQDDRYSLTVWSPTTDRVTPADKLYIRDNYDISKVFFDADASFTESIKEQDDVRTMSKEFYSGGNVLDFFRVPFRDAMKVTWAHRVNGQDDLDAAINDDTIMMLEADVRLRPEDNVPVMAHDPTDIVDGIITLEDWLSQVSNSSKEKGIKLDFKSTNVLEPSFVILRNLQEYLRVPIWINSDILRGPNSVGNPVNATEFFRNAQDIFPHATLSIGWTTAYRPIGENEGYSKEMVEEMFMYCGGVRQAITFPVRASLTAQSLDQLRWLVAKSNRYSLTVWHSGSEDVKVEDLVKIYETFDRSKVYYDLPEDLMSAFLAAVES